MDIRLKAKDVDTYGKDRKGSKMLIEKLSKQLSATSRFSYVMMDNVSILKSIEVESEYVIEEFEGAVQIRQAVLFNCFDMLDEEIRQIYSICSMVNSRFSGCKNFIDKWGVLITARDILSVEVNQDHLEVGINQVEFLSRAMMYLVQTTRETGTLASEEEIDTALEVPMLQ